MHKIVSSMLIFSLQFVLWTNLAFATQYTADYPAVETAYEHLATQYASPSFTPDIDALTYNAADKNQSSVDLCLPIALICTSAQLIFHIRTFNDYSIFSKVTWQASLKTKPPTTFSV